MCLGGCRSRFANVTSFAVLLLFAAVRTPASDRETTAEQRAAQEFERVRANPLELRDFLSNGSSSGAFPPSRRAFEL
jgi:hypothetical protein